jgi:putative ABC transport system ATP-binding protein
MSGQIMDLLEGINTAGTMIVMVTHNPELARRARRHVEITDGEISQHRRSDPQEPLAAVAPTAV